MKKHIPNLVTLLNLLAGCIAVIFAVNGSFITASLFVFLGIFFDFFDGLLARKLDVQSPLGIQLDSLADLVTSGVVPGIIMYKLIASAAGDDSIFVIDNNWNNTIDWVGVELSVLGLVGLLIPLASAYRLAKFNVDEDQQSYFKGLPVPANTLLILSIPLILHFQYSITVSHLFSNVWFLVGLSVLSCYLLNSNIKLFALKFNTWAFKPNTVRYLFLAASVLLLVVFQFIAIPLIIGLYIVVSLFTAKQIY